MAPRKGQSKLSHINRLRNLDHNQGPTAPTLTKTSTIKTSVTLVPVSHPKIPDLPSMNSLLFETLFFAYLLTALFGQFLFIYKTVWWYPSSLPPSTTTINFHLIDVNLVIFVVVVFSRRLLWLIFLQYLHPAIGDTVVYLAWGLIVSTCGVFWLTEIIKHVTELSEKESFYKIFFLCYPMILWIPLQILFKDGCINFFVTWAKASLNSSKNSVRPQRLKDVPTDIGDQTTSYANLGNASDAEQVREQVRLLCQDFNSRLTEIIFCSMVCAYYAGLMPMLFTKSHQSYDVTWSLQHTVLVWINSFAMLGSFLFPPKYQQVLHKCASLLGGYTSVRSDHIENADDSSYQEWAPYTVYTPGTIVKYRNAFYLASGEHNTAIPDDSSHSRFFFMFYKPLRLLSWLLGLHFSVIVFQIHVLIWSSRWDQLIVPALLQFFSYYVLFITLRDRIVLGKAYSFFEESTKQKLS